ncbi:hypothetical protein [Spirosoma utsteinense]|uniref:Lipoprotein n=1 Tax=Spirosoma utsteinense TaxID=2585773 RepID=A0ABR6W8J8_9BACT|nr:hypothetical protein [Spirosoma utsteinense]MBC3787219.1 hypothetical protein [Spirosoma utsteinense]MBC3792905.1 hypothetical protein [Spirosoma utsteinense]
MPYLTSFSGRVRLWATLLLLSACLPGCVTTRIVTIPNSCDSPERDPTTEKVVTARFWGLVQPANVTPPCAAPAGQGFNHLNGVTVWTTADQVLLSVVTLGIVIKRHIRWCCAPFIPPPDESERP